MRQFSREKTILFLIISRYYAVRGKTKENFNIIYIWGVGEITYFGGNGKLSSKCDFILTLFYTEKLKDVLRLADFCLF